MRGVCAGLTYAEDAVGLDRDWWRCRDIIYTIRFAVYHLAMTGNQCDDVRQLTVIYELVELRSKFSETFFGEAFDLITGVTCRHCDRFLWRILFERQMLVCKWLLYFSTLKLTRQSVKAVVTREGTEGAEYETERHIPLYPDRDSVRLLKGTTQTYVTNNKIVQITEARKSPKS